MIDVHDMMVDNLVRHQDNLIEVYKVYTRGIGDDWGDYYEDEELGGIPVTEEMLKNIGFKENTALVKFYRYWDKDYKYKLDVDEGYTNSGKRWSVHIDNDVCNTIGSGEFTYVHELQNLVRIITGFSLPITQEMIDGNTDKDTLA